MIIKLIGTFVVLMNLFPNSCWLVRMMVMLIDWMGYNANSYDGGNDG